MSPAYRRLFFVLSGFVAFALLVPVCFRAIAFHIPPENCRYDFSSSHGFYTDPTWRTSIENGNPVLRGENEGFAFFPKEILKENRRTKDLLPTPTELAGLKVGIKVERGFTCVSWIGKNQKLSLVFHPARLEIEQWSGDELVGWHSYPIDFPLGQWHNLQLSVQDLNLYIKLDDNQTIEIENAFWGQKVSFEACPSDVGTVVLIDNFEVCFGRPSIIQSLLADLVIVGRMLAYIGLFLLLVFWLLRIKPRYGFWAALALITALLSERPTLFFSRPLDLGFILGYLFYFFYSFITYDLVWSSNRTDLGTLLLVGALVGCFLSFGRWGLSPGLVMRFSVVSITFPLVMLDSFTPNPEVRVPPWVNTLLGGRRWRWTLGLIMLALLYSAYCAIGLIVSNLCFHLSLVIMAGELVLVYLLALLIISKGMNLREFLPTKRERKVILPALGVAYLFSVAYLLRVTLAASASPSELMLINFGPFVLMFSLLLVCTRSRLRKRVRMREKLRPRSPIIWLPLLLLFASLVSLVPPLVILIPIEMFLEQVGGIGLIIWLLLDTRRL